MTDYASDILIPASPNGIIVTMQYDENSSSSNRSGIIEIIADDAIYKPGASVIQKPKTMSVTISGSVQDQFNYPLIGATVQLEENPGIYTMTDDTGAYFLGNVPVTDTGHLIFSYIGYDDVIKEIDVNSSEQIIDAKLSITVVNPYLENRLSSESYEMVNSADYIIGSQSAVSFLISPLELDYGILEVSCVEAEGSGRLYLDITGGIQTSLLPFGKSVILADTGISTDDVIFTIELEGYTKVTLEFKRNDNVVFTANLDNT